MNITINTTEINRARKLKVEILELFQLFTNKQLIAMANDVINSKELAIETLRGRGFTGKIETMK